jgi:hypothetical protein
MIVPSGTACRANLSAQCPESFEQVMAPNFAKYVLAFPLETRMVHRAGRPSIALQIFSGHN